MKKKLILALAILLGCVGCAKADVLANTKYFPDEKFLGWVLKHFNKVRGSRLTDEELASVKEISSWKDYKDGFRAIVSLKGIEYFTELETLLITNGDYDKEYDNYIQEIDLSKNIKLKSFYFIAGGDGFYYGGPYPEYISIFPTLFAPSLAKESKNGGKSSTSIHRLRTVNLSNLPELRNVDIERHALSELDLRGCPNLQTVIVHDSEKAVDLKLDYCANLETFAYSKCTEGIQWPDFSLMPNLKAFYCDECNIKNLDLSNVAKKLEQLSCSKNPIARLDLSNYVKLKSLSCEGLPITSLDCSGLDSLKNINVTDCVSLQSFPTLPSGITTIMCHNVKALANADLNLYPKLEQLSAENCDLTTFDVSNHPNIIYLDLRNNHIAMVDFSGLRLVNKGKCLVGQQTIYVNAIPVPERKNYWRLLLPEDVDLNRIKSFKSTDIYKFNLYREYYEDEQGNLIPSFVINDPVKNSYSIYATYNYETGGVYIEPSTYHGSSDFIIRYESDVTVYAKYATSGVDDVAADKAVKGVKYFDLQGHESAEPFSGFNIEVTQYTDGTSQSRKLVH